MTTQCVALADIVAECEKDGLTASNGEKIALEIAKAFRVKSDEVAILRLEGQNLAFVYPAKLQNVGTIPVNTSGSVAGRTVTTKRAEAMNNFAQTRHATVFESVDLDGKSRAFGERNERPVIQKLMSVPVIAEQRVVGVIQVSRKGLNAPSSGPDFTAADVAALLSMAKETAKCFT